MFLFSSNIVGDSFCLMQQKLSSRRSGKIIKETTSNVFLF